MIYKKTQNESNPRMEKFLFYAKFVLLIVVIVLFIIGYSYTQKDFPMSIAVMKYEPPAPDDKLIPQAKALIVMDYSDYYDDAYSSFDKLASFLNSAEYIEYDLVLVNNSQSSSTLLEDIDDSLLIRIYQKKPYDCIVSVGNNSISAAKEIKELFFPRSELLLYGVSASAEKDIITPVSSVSKNVLNTILTSKRINPSVDTLLFLCQKNDYSDVIINIVENSKTDLEGTKYKVLYADETILKDAYNTINKQKDTAAVFYVSFLDDDSLNINHSQMINEIGQNISVPVYDLSPILENTDEKKSIRYWSYETPDIPLAYLAIQPDNTYDYNYELIEFAAKTISSDNYTDTAHFLSSCLENVGFDEFPAILHDQVEYCFSNELIIPKDTLQAGDIVFTSTVSNAAVDEIDGVSIYVNEDIVIRVNEKGILSFAKPLTGKYQVAYAHPYS